MFVPMVTVLLGLGFLLLPGRILSYMGLRAIHSNPEAIGEGRSSFAGPLLALGLACLLLQDPIALQPGLNFTLALAWTVSAFGRILQMSFDGALRRKRIQMRFLLAAVLAGIAWASAETPTFVCIEHVATHCPLLSGARNGFVLFVALLTFGLGLVAFGWPRLALRILRMEHRIAMPFAVGEPRGTLAGFYLAIGFVVLAYPQPADFVILVLGAAWLLTGVGRVLSIVLERGFTLYHIAGSAFELCLGAIVLAIVFGAL